ncbi:hypothetical protein [Streptomyces cinereoruber]|uniref:hypothetical protein n=1 Tax=Streptomyces cinereoruber TaxID=67260 RepID=UPI003653E06E
MTLSLTIGRDTFKICHKEGARTTVWDVSKNDSEEALIQTFRDVIAFVEGGQAQEGNAALLQAVKDWPAPVQGPDVSGGDVLPTNGWAAAYGPPPVPEHLQGEVELIQPGEDA